MCNKLFPYFLLSILILVLLLVFTPLVLLVLRGIASIGTCIQSEEILFSIRLSLITSSISTLICLLFSLPAAYCLARLKAKAKKIISILIFLPMSLPHLISGIALLLLLGNSGIGGFLSKFGVDFIFTKKGIVAAQVFINISFMIKILKTAIEESSVKMEFIARTLGCNNWQSFVYITIPSIKSNIFSSLVITWSRALGEFGAVIMLAGTTRMKTEVLPTAIFLNMSTGDLDIAIGTATILITISLISLLLFEIIERKSMS
ncbi:MAG TPA: molybdenum ABC transporter permease [Clostridiales bacterium]|nr:molybdenum ABC transporter permease [Clostridiales bacterium]